MRRLGPLALAALTLTLTAAFGAVAGAPARADEGIGGQPPRFGENPRRDYESSQRFAVELKFGPYSPNIDASPGLNGNHPFADLFPPDKGKSRPPGKLLTQVEFDYQFWHRWYGNFAIGSTAGYYRRTTHSFAYNTNPSTGAETQSCNPSSDPTNTNMCVRSGDTTALNIVPLSMLFVYRFDYLAQRYKIPFIPYFKIGLAYYAWWIENGGGFLSIAQFTPAGSTQSQGGWGGTFGWTMNPGGAFLLDVLDPSAARTIDAELGINHTYLFCEFNYADITGFGAKNKMDLSDTTLNAGIAFEF
ncbi:MAG TPA: MXAN_2562 family outer membrane beta-barrel protein [Polyangia bacterium]|nr:MXAN_2562 family outer membrane beta-barrel protein [Polyangia bacterium]